MDERQAINTFGICAHNDISYRSSTRQSKGLIEIDLYGDGLFKLTETYKLMEFNFA